MAENYHVMASLLLVPSIPYSHMCLVMRKLVFGVCDLERLKPACSADEVSKGLDISAIASKGIILSGQRSTKALIRLHRCAG